MPPETTFTARLLSWYDQGHRDLPWRQTSDPWAIWVSEIMLQQTRVEAVRAIYAQFMAAYPKPSDFADVDEDELLTAWRGLGYYRRARLLRDGAQAVVTQHNGKVPADVDALRELPGIGAYTQGAVASIAFNHPIVAIDGNVERVLARHRGIADQVKVGAGAKAIRASANAILDESRPGDFNQAMMELGATVCTPKSPHCQTCPVARDCIAHAQGRVHELPVLPARRAMVDVSPQAVLVPRPDGNILGVRIPTGKINAGQIDLPGSGPLTSCDPADLGALLQDQFNATIAVENEIGTIRHGITHHRIQLTAHWGSCSGTIQAPLISAPPDASTPWTTMARKVFRIAGLHEEQSEA